MTDLPATPAASAEEQRGDSLRRVVFRRLFAAIPDFLLAGTFLLTWIDPYALGQDALRFCMMTMILEFIIMHSSLFIGSCIYAREDAVQRFRNAVGFALIYTAMAAGVAIAFQRWWPVLAFGSLMLTRVLGVLTGDTPSTYKEDYMRAGWGLSVLYYMGGFFVTTILPIPIPELGVAAEVRHALDFPAEGFWVDEPQEMLAFGVIYFGLSGVGELYGRYERHWDVNWRESDNDGSGSDVVE